jgi:hypothetical protein
VADQETGSVIAGFVSPPAKLVGAEHELFYSSTSFESRSIVQMPGIIGIIQLSER